MKTETNLFRFYYLLLFPAVFCPLIISIHYAHACSVPVFRYALERWKPDAYKGIYIYRGEISEQDQSFLDQLNNASRAEAALNLIVKPVDADTFSTEKLTAFFKGPIPDKLPLLAIWYPGQMGKSPPFLRETPSQSLIDKLVQSPKRQQIAEGLIKGESVVWVFIPSGNKEADDGALAMIKQALDLALNRFKRNPFTILDGAKRKRLTYGFPILTLLRDDPAEYIFIETLMKSEPDLFEHTDEPMLFPVFGRGRSLGCLFGEYITARKIREAAVFLSGACSCEVKELNPGVDLLLSAPWDMVVMNSFIEEDPLPELTGVMPESDEPLTCERPTAGSADAMPEDDQARGRVNSTAENSDVHEDNDSGVLKIYAASLAGLILVVAVSGFVISRRRGD